VPYLRGFRVLDFGKFMGEDSKTTYEHVGRFLAQVNKFGITDVHRVRLFPYLCWVQLLTGCVLTSKFNKQMGNLRVEVS
jgi:hypothetical protein